LTIFQVVSPHLPLQNRKSAWSKAACHGKPTALKATKPGSISSTSMDERSTFGTSSVDTLNRYHPGGDPRNPPKDAPSALHSVIVPNVNLPKVSDTSLLAPAQWRGIRLGYCAWESGARSLIPSENHERKHFVERGLALIDKANFIYPGAA